MLTFVPCSRNLITLSRRGLGLLILTQARSRSSSTGRPPQAGQLRLCRTVNSVSPALACSTGAAMFLEMDVRARCCRPTGCGSLIRGRSVVRVPASGLGSNVKRQGTGALVSDRIQEVAERANVPEDFVQQLVAAGALPRAEAELGSRRAVRRARLLWSWRAAGLTVETVIALVNRAPCRWHSSMRR